MLNEDEKKLFNLTMTYIVSENTAVKREKIRDAVSKTNTLYNLPKKNVDAVVKHIEEINSITMMPGSHVQTAEHKIWFDPGKYEMDYWERYRKYLINDKGLPIKVVNVMDEDTNKLVGLLGNPNKDDKFKRYGLVIGNVQSGKTANYISVINKAADVGYKVVILITGTLNTLRNQTQERIDQGFLGLDSASIGKKKERSIGVGVHNPNLTPVSYTTRSSDFDRNSAKQIGMSLDSKQPIIFVIKKNTSVLDNLKNWIESISDDNQRMKLPMLLIDDESDYASIDTAKPEEDPTRTNSSIRELLALFRKSNYLSYTATPFANVFIDPDEKDDHLHQDLFPRDFIYSLDEPENYIGPERIYDKENGDYNHILREINDLKHELPLKHKKDYKMETIPQSLKKAIYSFLISNAIRDLRREPMKHRSMLINISRYTAVQDHLSDLINERLRDTLRELKDNKSPRYRKQSALYKEFGELFEEEFATATEFSFDVVLEKLHESNAAVKVSSVNSTNKAHEVLNYSQYNDIGLKIITIGGQILSRGLTLEGLSVSYFHRNSRYYDTLMQMGRWFGYRPYYADLCRIYMHPDAMDWYGYISEAASELKKEISEMKRKDLTPKDFGLRVMSHPASLMISAPNKMRSAKPLIRKVRMSGEVIETPKLFNSEKTNKKNFQNTKIFIDKLIERGYEITAAKSPNDGKKSNHFFIESVHKGLIKDFLGKFTPHPQSVYFKASDVNKYIDKVGKKLDHWDVIFVDGSQEKHHIHNKVEVSKSQRKYSIPEEDVIQISGVNNRLGSSNITKFGLTKSQYDHCIRELEKEPSKTGKKKNPSDKTYLKYVTDRNPLLMIYLVKLDELKGDHNHELKLDTHTTLGLGLGFPKIEEFNEEPSTIEYRLNKKAFEDYKASEYVDEVEEDE